MASQFDHFQIEALQGQPDWPWGAEEKSDEEFAKRLIEAYTGYTTLGKHTTLGEFIEWLDQQDNPATKLAQLAAFGQTWMKPAHVTN